MTDDLTTADPRTLTAPDLVKFTKALLAKEDRRQHWTVAAIALGRITDERIFERTEYGAALSPEAWAKDKLGMTRGEVRLALKLWRSMNRHPEVPWTSLPKPRALLLDEVLTAGGDTLDWTARARNAKSTTAFEREVRTRLGDEESFQTLRIRYPDSMAELVDEAFRRAVFFGVGQTEEGLDPAKWREPAMVFRALEVVLKDYIDATTPIPAAQEAPEKP